MKILPSGSGGRLVQMSLIKLQSVVKVISCLHKVSLSEDASLIENNIPSMPTVDPLAKFWLRYWAIVGVSGSPSFINRMPDGASWSVA